MRQPPVRPLLRGAIFRVHCSGESPLVAVCAGCDLHICDTPISHPHPPIGRAAVAGGHQPLIVGHIHNAADDFKSGLLYSVGFVAAHPADATEPSSNRRERHRPLPHRF